MEISAKTVMELRKKTGAGMMDCKKALAETDGDMETAVKYLREKGMSAAKKRAEREASEGKVVFKISDDMKKAAIVEVNSETDFVARNEEFVSLAANIADQAFDKGPELAENNMIAPEKLDLSGLTHLSGKIGEKLVLNRAAYMEVTDGFIASYMHPGDQLGVLVVMSGDEAALKNEAAMDLAHDLGLQIAALSPRFVDSEEIPEEVKEQEKAIYKQQMKNEGKPDQIIEKIAEGKLRKFYEEVCLVNQMYVKEQKNSVTDRIKEAEKVAGGSLKVVKFIRFKVGEGE